MRILLFLDSGFDTWGPSLHLYKDLIEDFLESGHVVHLIESYSTRKDPEVPDSFLKYDNFSYDLLKLNVVKKSHFAKRYLEGVRYCYSSIPLLKKMTGFDIAMVQSCPWAPFAVSFVKKYVKVPTVYNVQDMFPGSSIASGVMTQKWMQKIFFAFHKIAYRKADAISVISEDMKEKVMEQGVPADKIHVIVNWYDDKNMREIPWDENVFVKEQNMDRNKFYVQYAGTMGFVFDYKMVLAVAELLKDHNDIVFQMIGQGSQKEAFMKEAEERHLDSIQFLPLQKQEMVSHVYSACSICLIPLKRGVIGNSVPSKAGLLMSCHRTIVNSIDETSDYAQMFIREKMGVSASNLDPDAVAEGILLMKENPELCKEYADRGQIFGVKYYSRSVNTTLYKELYEKVYKDNLR